MITIKVTHIHAVVQVVAGLGLNIFPAIFIAVYARVAPIETQGILAAALTVGVYVAQLINAFIVEGRLATPEADHDLSVPPWIALLSIASGALLAVGPTVANPAVLIISSIGLMSGLLISRTIGVVRGRWRQEAAAAALLILSGAAALVMATRHNEHCVRVLAIGAVAATMTRYWPRSKTGASLRPPDLRRSGWVTGETAVVGAVQPAITSVVLITVGPAASVAFRVISTVSGALEPILSYGRYRLLAHGHKGEVAIIAAIFVAALAAVLGGAFGGLGALIFGSAWDNVGVAALLLACLWKVLMLVSNLPFAALRKAGETATVFWIRAASTVIYLVIALSFLFIWGTNTAIFLAFVIAEGITLILYHWVASKGAPEYDVKIRRGASEPRRRL